MSTRMSPAGLLVGETPSGGLFQCRPYQLVIDAVEIDQQPVKFGLLNGMATKARAA